MKFHHIGIPTNEPREGETYSADSKLFITDIDSHPYRVEWLRFEPDSPLPQIIQAIPHLAFEVEDVEKAIEGEDILVQPKTTANGHRIAFIIEGGAPIEFVQSDCSGDRGGERMCFHHAGLPTLEFREGEHYIDALKLYVTSIDAHPYRLQWMRFETDSPMPKLLQTVPHVAFTVGNLQQSIEGKEMLSPPELLPNGDQCAFIIEGGAPIEFVQLGNAKDMV